MECERLSLWIEAYDYSKALGTRNCLSLLELLGGGTRKWTADTRGQH